MDLTAQFLRESLHRVDLEGWDSAPGRQLLDHVRRAVVVPVVRRSGLRGPAADQAEASGWEAAWDALRRPSARTAENPGGMVWVAVRRAVAAESEFSRTPGARSIGALPQPAAGDGSERGTTTHPDPPAPGSERRAPVELLASPDRRPWAISLDHLMDGGWQPTQAPMDPRQERGPIVAALLDGLVEAGWDRADAADAIAILADHASPDRSGSPTTRWRWVALRLGVAEWQARRLAGVLLGGGEWPSVLELAVLHGTSVLGDPAVQGALRSTACRWSAGPGAWLAEWDTRAAEQGIA